MAGLKKSDIVVFSGAKLRSSAGGDFGNYQDLFSVLNFHNANVRTYGEIGNHMKW